MKNFAVKGDFPLSPPIRIKVFQNYDKLDRLAFKRGYKTIEPSNDETFINYNLHVGLQNSHLHCGWIATMSDPSQGVSSDDQVKLLNEKFTKVSQTHKAVVGFCQTGNFSVGYSIYIKEE